MSSAGASESDVNDGPSLLAGLTVLQAISTGLYITRMYTRFFPRARPWWDDLFVTLAVTFSLVSYILLAISVSYGLGRHNDSLKPEDAILAEKYLFLNQPPYAWALVFAKISITTTLLRVLRESPAWVWFLRGMVVLQVGIGVTMNAFQLSLCRPLAGIWDPSVATSPGTKCLTPDVSTTSIYVTAAFIILTDVILSLIPLTFIAQLQRPLREKAAIAFIMGLGLVASCASIYKTTLAKKYGVTGDTLVDGVGLTIWSMLEMELGIMAACIPALKQLFEKILGRMGLLSSRREPSQHVYQAGRPHPGLCNSGSSHKLRTIPTTSSAGPSATFVEASSQENMIPVARKD